MQKPTSSQLLKAANIREQIERLEAEYRKLMTGESPAKPGPQKKTKKRTMSPEGRARIAAAAKKRWAKAKREGKNRLG